MPAKTCKLSVTESVYSPAAKVDREAGIIRGGKILGATSTNQREYTPAARAAAARLYEGMAINLNHPSKESIRRARGIEEKWGWLEAIEARDDGVFGNLAYLKSHPHTEPLLNRTTFGYDPAGNQIQTINPLGAQFTGSDLDAVV